MMLKTATVVPGLPCFRALYGSYSEQEDKVEREWCVGLPTPIFAPWVGRLARLLDRESEAGPPPSVRYLSGGSTSLGP